MSPTTVATRSGAAIRVDCEQPPLGPGRAALAVAHCAWETVALAARRRIHRPRTRTGLVLRFADGSAARVYRETVVRRHPTEAPAVLVVEFRLRWVRGGFMHALFRAESILNTPLFVGFPGFVSKLWMAHDRNDVYRGVYEWDDPVLAHAYARALWRVLTLVSVAGSIHYVVLPGLHRDALLGDGRVIDDDGATGEWWRPVGVEPAAGGRHTR